MCLYPKRIVNRKYTANKKNGGVVPTPPDSRVLYIQVPCGNCKECMEQKARDWLVRLNEELKTAQYPYFLTLTYSNKELGQILDKGYEKVNLAATYAVRHFLERWRKDHKKSIKHWFVTELGHTNTERIHIHGIIFSDEPLEIEKIEYKQGQGWRAKWKYWKYGEIFLGEYCNARSTSYIVKYINKIDKDHKDYKSIVLCSPGIGKAFLDSELAKTYKYIPGLTKTYYRLNNGAKVATPKYYKNHLFTEDEREKLWIESMDKEQIVIMGNTYNEKIVPGATIESVVKKQKQVNESLGYGTDSKEWRKRDYNITKKMLQRSEARQELLQKYYESCAKRDKIYKKFAENLEVSK